MKIAMTYRHVTLAQPIEALMEHHIQKIGVLLKSYSPDLVHLRGVLETNPHGVEFTFSANLSIPTGVLHASATAPDIRGCARKALMELEGQIKKHQAHLRKEFDRETARKAG